jgi:hypothetical protein
MGPRRHTLPERETSGLYPPTHPTDPEVPHYDFRFVLFLAVTASLFLRPGEIVEGFLGGRFFLVLILPLLAVSLPTVLTQLTPGHLREHPVTLCVVGVLGSILVSFLPHLDPSRAGKWGFEFAKVLAYYLLLTGLVNTAPRLRHFILWVMVFCLSCTVLALLNYYGVLSLANSSHVVDGYVDPREGREIGLRRLTGSGLFGDPNDPNDLSLVLVVGVFLALSVAGDRDWGPVRYGGLVAVGIFLFALTRTYSRGGLLALAGGLTVFSLSRFGWRRSLVLGGLMVPVAFALLPSRQTGISTDVTTGQSRLQLWSDGLTLFRENSVFGVGARQFAESAGQVAHNSFLHCFSELGFLGGTCFLGAFVLALWPMHRLGVAGGEVRDPELGRLRPYVLAAVAGYAVGLLTLTICYEVPTYLVLGLAAAYLQIATGPSDTPGHEFGVRTAGTLVIISLFFLVALQMFVYAFVRW